MDLWQRAGRKCDRLLETITAVGGQAAANSPVLTALNERLDANLAPRIAQMRQTLGPVRDAVGNVANAVAW